MPEAILKLKVLLKDIAEHPRTGIGQIEQLKYYKEGTWSRRIDREHRIIYRIDDDANEILVLSVYGHYNDK